MPNADDTLDVIDLMYRAALEPELWPQALHRLALATGGFGTAMIPITPGDSSGLIVSPELADSRPDYDRHWWRYDTRVQRIFSRKITDGVCCEAELFTEEEIKRDPMRQEFCRPFGMGAFAAQLVTPWPDFVVAFSVQRPVHHGHFDKQDLERLKLIGRHAARALLVSTRLSVLPNLGQSLQIALGQLGCGAAIIDRQLQVVVANDALLQLMEDGLTVSQGYLRASHRDQQDVLQRFLLSVACRETDGDAGPIALPRPSGRRPLLLQAIPIGGDDNVHSRPAALVMVVDSEAEEGGTPVKALRLLGLTPSEARLAVLIGGGRTRGEAAEALGISDLTVSDTVKQIYAKLEISRQSELVRLVERLAAVDRPRKG
jgi:DNA-binding CsgD family transcriptional regulator/PAS domain-containing protein